MEKITTLSSDNVIKKSAFVIVDGKWTIDVQLSGQIIFSRGRTQKRKIVIATSKHPEGTKVSAKCTKPKDARILEELFNHLPSPESQNIRFNPPPPPNYD